MLKWRKNFVTVKSEGQEKEMEREKILNRLKEGRKLYSTPFYNVKKLKQMKKKWWNWNKLGREEEKDSELG